MSSEKASGPKPPSPPLPDDGPRYHQEDASAALLKSAHWPYDDWNGLECPDCRDQYLTLDAVARHHDTVHASGRWLSDDADHLDALEVCGEVWVASNVGSSPSVVHPLECDYSQGATAGRTITHRGEIPLSVEGLCSGCLALEGVDE